MNEALLSVSEIFLKVQRPLSCLSQPFCTDCLSVRVRPYSSAALKLQEEVSSAPKRFHTCLSL